MPKEKDYEFICPICKGTGYVEWSTKFLYSNEIPCTFILCKGEGRFTIPASSKKKAKEILEAVIYKYGKD